MKHLILLCALPLIIVMSSCSKTEVPDDLVNPLASGEASDANGTLCGVFDVYVSGQGTKYIRFSKGNLQYKASSNTWRFAEQQYSFIGENNVKRSSSYTGWIDLFAFGTSGWSGSGARYYHPYDGAFGSNSDYLCKNLTGTYANADWGWYNKISNGGNKANYWRTLTREEWNALLGRSGKSADAIIHGISGLLLLPDYRRAPDGSDKTWTWPAGIPFSSTTENVYSDEQWNMLEQSGCVFLPDAGYIDIMYTTNNGSYDWGWQYWSSSAKLASQSYYNSGHAYAATSSRSSNELLSVRLITEH